MKIRLARAWLAGVVGLASLIGVSAVAQAQTATIIKGRVVSEAGMPLAGTSVFIDAIKAGTQTGEDGTYTITVAGRNSGPAVLVARRIGYRRAQSNINLGGTTLTVDFTLQAQAVQLTGMMVTALSVQREKSTIGTSQQALDNTSLTATRESNLINAMSGKASGLNIQASGAMGGSTRVVIRGAGSITGNNQPLFIVDGVPISNAGFSNAGAGGLGRDYGNGISDVNPDDIASITVLKGPNAAALYGSRASNGAVVITTKTGRSSAEGVKVQFRSYATADVFSVIPDYQNGYGQGFGGEFSYLDGAWGGLNDGADESWGPKLDGRLIDQFTGKQQPWIAHPNNVKDFFNVGHTVSNSISVTANGAKSSARLSLTKDNVLGIVPNSKLAKLAASLTASAAINDKWNVSGSLQVVQNQGINRTEVGYSEGNPFMGFTWFGRQVDVAALKNKYYNDDGSLFNWNTNYHTNPYWVQFDNSEADTRDRIIAQATVNYQMTDWLKGMVRAGQDFYRFTTTEQFAKGNIDWAPASNGAFRVNNQRASEYNVEGIVTATKTLGQFDMTGNVGGNIRRNSSYNNFFSTGAIVVPGIYNLANSEIAPTVTNSERQSGVNSIYGSAVMTWNRVATLEVTGRNDYSSTLPKENSSYFYPSINGSVVLSDLFPSITKGGFVTYAKLRGGWAQVGSDADPYSLATTYTGSSAKFGGRTLFTLPDASNNQNLKPERTFGSEGGIEVSFLDDKLTVDATYYTKVTKDQIFALAMAPAIGYSSAYINAGQMTNKGVEALVTLKTLDLKNGFSWRTTFNYTRNRNSVDDLAPGLTTIVLATNWGARIEARVGEPYGTIYGRGYQKDSVTGKVITRNGLPYSPTTLVKLGNVNPDWTGGVNNEFRFKNYTFSFLLDIRQGGQNFSSGNWWGHYAGILSTTMKGREQEWDSPGIKVDGIDRTTGQPNTVTVTSEEYFHNYYPVIEAGIYNTGFVKLRDARISWDVPAKLLTNLKLSALNVSLIGRNLYTWTDFPNYDPENASNSGNAGQGFDMGALPTTKSVGINFTITP
ncbi:MAG: SusC/RagA family TonB-linked outer membrane protein [Gemmatimonadaceae bacterium]|nr:SusC/RagA family TonB-linked outer membrane protein [Gemmatimonadaceae bacterium]